MTFRPGQYLYRDEHYNVFVKTSGANAYHIGINLLMQEWGMGIPDPHCGIALCSTEEKRACLAYIKALLELESRRGDSLTPCSSTSAPDRRTEGRHADNKSGVHRLPRVPPP
ncbi:MAG: hypothetical protein IT435_02605 [Phycisphaerales bacterium]|nr:hypothetical protein [Phycisphaerales bacterium]